MNANIYETIPSVLKLIQAYKTMKLKGEPKKLAKLIIRITGIINIIFGS